MGARGVGEPAQGSVSALTAAISDALGGHIFGASPVTADMIINHVAGTSEDSDFLLKIISEVDMVATSHDVMPDIELYQPADEATARLAARLGNEGWLLSGGQDTYGWLRIVTRLRQQ